MRGLRLCPQTAAAPAGAGRGLRFPLAGGSGDSGDNAGLSPPGVLRAGSEFPGSSVAAAADPTFASEILRPVRVSPGIPGVSPR